jgi:Na+/melibiose symporter-like transporter
MLPYLLSCVVLPVDYNVDVWLTYTLLLLECGILTSIPMWKAVSFYLGKKKTFSLGWLFVSLLSITLFFVCNRGNHIIFMFMVFLLGFAAGGWPIFFSSMQADVIE